MSLAQKNTTAPYPSVGADEEQSLNKITNLSIATEPTENKSPGPSFNEMFRKMQRIYDPAYLPTVSMQDLYETIYPSRPPVIDGLLHDSPAVLSAPSHYRVDIFHCDRRILLSREFQQIFHVYKFTVYHI